jgi:uncharacterized membrane protein
MEVLAGLVGLLIGAVLMLAVPITAIVALVRANQALRTLDELHARVHDLSRRLSVSGAPPAQPAVPLAQPTAVPPAAAVAEPGSLEARPAPLSVSASPREPAAASVPASQPAARTARAFDTRAGAGHPRTEAEFVGSLGPKILVGAGGLAVVVFLALFVRYAWENNWVGPLGRVLSAGAFSLALVVGGLRIMSRRYRPLGQGLTAAGFAGLYVTAWAAHAVYELVARATASAMLLAVVAAAAIVASRNGARLLAGLAWLGGYLAPVLLSTHEDRAETLFVYLLLLGAGALWLDRQKRWPEVPLLAALGTLILYASWYAAHFSEDRLGVAVAGSLALAALFALAPARGGALAGFLAVLAVASSSSCGIAMAGEANRPLSLLLFFVSIAFVAELAASRSTWTRPLGAALAALGVHAWLDRYFTSERTGVALSLGLGIALVYVGLLALTGLRSQPLRVPAALAHVAASLLAFTTLEQVFEPTSGRLFASVLGLAGAHLLLGLDARRRGGDPLRVRVTLGLAVTFFTLALPVRLGLTGTTLAWAAEGVLLTWLGVKQRAALARGFGYAVLLLALCRLFLRHVPLHPEPFAPVLNAAFGTWLFVIVALALARRLARSVGDDEIAWLDGACALLFGPLTLLLLFGLLSHEASAYFGHASRAAAELGDRAGALRAERQGGLALSVLWTLFATALLSAGLLLRSLPLFYSSYALFAATAAKVVLVDVATLPTLYRMLSFLALGALLLAGAWLNLRFRERLTAASDGGVLRS